MNEGAKVYPSYHSSWVSTCIYQPPEWYPHLFYPVLISRIYIWQVLISLGTSRHTIFHRQSDLSGILRFQSLPLNYLTLIYLYI